MNVQRSPGDGKPEQQATWTVFCVRVIFDKPGSRHCFSKIAYINSTPDALVQCVLRVLELPAFHLGPDLFNKTPSLRAHFQSLTNSARCRGRAAIRFCVVSQSTLSSGQGRRVPVEGVSASCRARRLPCQLSPYSSSRSSTVPPRSWRSTSKSTLPSVNASGNRSFGPLAGGTPALPGTPGCPDSLAGRTRTTLPPRSSGRAHPRQRWYMFPPPLTHDASFAGSATRARPTSEGRGSPVPEALAVQNLPDVLLDSRRAGPGLPGT